jgi:PKD repeat protein
MKSTYTPIQIHHNLTITLKYTNRRILAFLLICFILLISLKSNAQICCPEFKLKDAIEICPTEGSCQPGGTANGGRQGLAACKLTPHTYTIYPNDPTFTYSWTITGGTPASTTGNPVTIVWGSGATGIIKVVISNLGTGGSCLDSITQNICLIDGPQANFTLAPSTVCLNSPVVFTNTSVGGDSYHWDFGDGSISNLASPPAHSYSLPGTYTVTLVAINSGSPGAPAADAHPACGCRDTISQIVTVLPSTGPSIDLDCCFGTKCPGDTSTFCTSLICSSYNWSVTGGTIISGSNTSCIKVKWNATYSVPTTVSLSVPGCGSAPCPGTTTIPVPVLYPNLPISGPTTLCVGASGSFFLPVMPGTYYLWTTTAPTGTYSFNQQNRNTASSNISFSQPGTYVLQCQYQNPLAGCNGNSVIVVNVLPVFSFSGDETVCEGSTVAYTANGTATWLSTPIGATVPAGISSVKNITFNLPGTYTITATANPTGVFCNPTAVKFVKVVAKPILNAISGPITVCPGKNYTYSISSNLTGSPFVWSITGGTGTVLSMTGTDRQNAIVRYTGSGPWTVNVFQKIEITPGVYCQSLTQTLLVNPYPAPTVTGNASVCVDAIETYVASGLTPPGGIQWTIVPSSQGTILSGQGTSTVNIQWHGTPTTAVLTATHCSGSGSLNVTIVNPPTVANITANGPTGYCLPNLPINLQLSTSPGFASYQWYLNNGLIPGANASNYMIPNATFTGVGTYYFSVLVSNGSCTITKYTYVVVDSCNGGGGGSGGPPNPINCTIDFTMIPNPACENQPVTFTAIPTGPGFSFSWDFGDNATSFISPTQHSYVAAGTDTVTLTATIGSCVAIKKKVITINPTPSCLITSADTTFCPGGSEVLTATPGLSSYQWYLDGVLLPGETFPTHTAITPGEYEVEVSNAFGCISRSNSIYMYLLTPPIARISGDRSFCDFPGNTASVSFSAYSEPAYSYDWSSNVPVSFSPNNSALASFTTATLTLPGVLPLNCYFVVKVTDTLTGCSSRDTICVTFFEKPPVTTTYVTVCEGGSLTLTPTPINTFLYLYQWNNGSTTPVITVSEPGSYSVTLTDKLNGCSSSALAGTIYGKPDLSLFPTGCDTIMCKTDTVHFYIPLPLNALAPLNNYAAAYPNITWYDNGNYGSPIASGQNFAFVTNGSGSHQISVVVQNSHGCVDTAGVYCLTAVCGDIMINCPSDPILLPCNTTHPTSADALNAIGAITDSCPGPLYTNVSGGTPTPLAGCWWSAIFKIKVNNGCGQSDSCFVEFRWKEDHEPPYFNSCPSAAIQLPCNTIRPTLADALGVVGPAADNCPGVVAVTSSGGAATNTGGCNWTATFSVIATDSCNNTATCFVTYNWKEDTVKPQFGHCPGAPILLPCNTTPPVEELIFEVGGVTDNCTGPITVVTSGGTPTPLENCFWSATYLITATDECGNTNTCSLIYRWKVDHTPPQFSSCPSGVVQLPCNSPRPTAASAIALVGSATDNCSGVLNIQASGGTASSTTGCNWTATFLISATDSCGNTGTCSITYTWKEDLVPPTFFYCPVKPILLPCNPSRPVAENVYEIVHPITDNCPGTVSTQITGGTAVNTSGCEWTSTFTITATDACGNVSTCNVTYKWTEDTTPPVFAHCPTDTITRPCNSPHPTAQQAILAAGPATDNCPGSLFYSDCIPPLDGQYGGTFTLTYGPGVMKLRNPVLGSFTDCYAPPIGIGQSITRSLGTTITFEISANGGLTWDLMHSPAEMTIRLTKTDENDSISFFESEMLQLNIGGGTLPPGIIGRESPVLASTGLTKISIPNPGTGDYSIESFFDIFTELSIDGGITWLAANSSGRVKLKKSVTVTVTGGTATAGSNCWWKSSFTLTAVDGCGNSTVCNVHYKWKEDHVPPTFAHCPEAPIVLPLNSPRPTIEQALAAAGNATDNCPGIVTVTATSGGVETLPGCIKSETFTITAVDECGNTSVCHVTFTWDVTLSQPVIHGTAAVCAGTTGVIYSTLAGMLNYSWSVSSGGTITSGAGTNIITVTWTTPGPKTVSVTYSDGFGCMPGSPAVFNVVVYPLPNPVLTGPTSVCNNSSNNVYTTNPGMTNYIWYIPPGALVTAGGTTTSNTVTITWTNAGTKLVKVNFSNAFGCMAVTPKQLNVVVKASPVPAITGPSTTIVNTNTTYSTTPWQTGYSWSVSPGGSIVSGQGTRAVSVSWSTPSITPTTHWVELNYTNLSGCSAPVATRKYIQVTSGKSSPTGVNSIGGNNTRNNESEAEEVALVVYPNPSNGSFSIRVTTSHAGIFDLKIVNAIGELVQEVNDIQIIEVYQRKLDLRNLTDGIYSIILIGTESITIEKTVILRE